MHISHACFIVEAETVGSQSEELTRPLVDAFHVKIVAVCQVIPRGPSSGKNLEAFNESARVLNSYWKPRLNFLTFSSRNTEASTAPSIPHYKRMEFI